MKTVVPTYIVNLPERSDRRKSILSQFRGLDMFSVELVPAIKHEIGGRGLWKTFIQIVKKERCRCSDFFLMCEDDHVFTDCFSMEQLEQQVNKANSLGADILSGGVSWMQHPIQVDANLFWLEAFNGMQFTIVYSRFYSKLIEADSTFRSATDFDISALSDNIFVIHPFLSVQKEFGYSDVTSKNAEKGYVKSLFEGTSQKLDMLKRAKAEYEKRLKR